MTSKSEASSESSKTKTHHMADGAESGDHARHASEHKKALKHAKNQTFGTGHQGIHHAGADED